MRIFVTGGTGFLGRQIVKRLVAAGHEVCCLVRSMNAATHLQQPGVQLVQGDLRGKGSLAAGMKGCSCAINAAAIFDFWLPDAGAYREVNVAGTRNVMEAVLEAGVSKVVHVSTVVVYGKPATSPATEATPVGPVRFSEYAQTKYEGELIAWELRKARALPLVVVYPGGILGPGDTKASGQYIRMLLEGKMPAAIFNDVSFPFVHVNDVAEAIARAAEKENNLGERYLVAGGNPTFGQMNQMISEIAGIRLPTRTLPGAMALASAALLTAIARFTKKPPAMGMSLDQMRTMKNALVVDGSKAEKELGIRYTPIRQALKEVIASIRL